MGSLSSRASSAASTPKIVYVNTPSVSTNDTGQDENETNNEIDDALSASEERSEDLLRRKRGTLGTIQTSLGGVLNDITSQVQRKTLLGE